MNILPVKGNDYFANLHNIGGAHGHYRSQSVAEFKQRLATAYLMGSFEKCGLFCYTNSYQGTERNFLKELGFTATATGHLMVHTIHRTALKKVLDEDYKLVQKALDVWREEDAKDGRKFMELRVGDHVFHGQNAVSKYTVCEVHDIGGMQYVGSYVSGHVASIPNGYNRNLYLESYPPGQFNRKGRLMADLIVLINSFNKE